MATKDTLRLVTKPEKAPKQSISDKASALMVDVLAKAYDLPQPVAFEISERLTEIRLEVEALRHMGKELERAKVAKRGFAYFLNRMLSGLGIDPETDA